MPNDNCPLCVGISRAVGHAVLEIEPPFLAAGDDTPDQVRAHTLAAICSWWVLQAMQDPTLGPDAVVRCVANCLAYEHGVSGADRLTAVKLARPA